MLKRTEPASSSSSLEITGRFPGRQMRKSLNRDLKL